jgi:PBP1b-binding outer membrane lipoprotein LpoB
MKQSIIYIAILSVSIFLFGCSQPKEKKEKRINLVIVNFFPAFIESSTAILDLSNNHVIFKRIGAKTYYQVMEMPDIVKKQAINTLSFKLDVNNYIYLKDSIQFTEADFFDREIKADDGIFSTILYVFEDGAIKDVDLNNSITDSPKNLVIILIDAALSQPSDSLTFSYLEKLKRYFD